MGRGRNGVFLVHIILLKDGKTFGKRDRGMIPDRNTDETDRYLLSDTASVNRRVCEAKVVML